MALVRGRLYLGIKCIFLWGTPPPPNKWVRTSESEGLSWLCFSSPLVMHTESMYIYAYVYYIYDKPRWETIHALANSSKGYFSCINHRQFIYHQACDKPVTGTTDIHYMPTTGDAHGERAQNPAIWLLCWRCLVSKWHSMSPKKCNAWYSDTSSTNISS